MLKQYPMLRYVLQKAFWYLLTFVVAVAINFTLPRMGENNPVDIIMGKAAQGLSPEQAKLKKETLLKAFGMAELDDQGNVIYDPEVDENGQVKMVKVVKRENGAPVLKTVLEVNEDGSPKMIERQKLDEQGNPVFEEKPVLDAKGKPVMEKDPKTKKKVAKVEQVAVMEQIQAAHQDRGEALRRVGVLLDAAGGGALQSDGVHAQNHHGGKEHQRAKQRGQEQDTQYIACFSHFHISFWFVQR